eukprot:1160603-Pelagomonas_calceolata.AAC.4
MDSVRAENEPQLGHHDTQSRPIMNLARAHKETYVIITPCLGHHKTQAHHGILLGHHDTRLGHHDAQSRLIMTVKVHHDTQPRLVMTFC